MKIHHITTVSQSLIFLSGQVKDMVGRGLRVYVSSRPEQQLTDFAESEGATAVGVHMERAIDPVADIKSIRTLVRSLRSIKPDIVHAHTPKGGLIGTIAGRIVRTPIVIYHIRGLPYMELRGWKRKLMMLTERVSCALATEVFCVSHSIADVAVKDGLVRRDKIKVFLHGSGNGVDARIRFNPRSYTDDQRSHLREKYGIPTDALLVLYVGRLAVDKGIQELAQAWASISANHSNVRLMMVGELDERDPVSQSIMEDLIANPMVIMAGMQKDTPEYYAAADIVVLPTYREGFPNVLLEASSMALPIVATRIPGCIDAVEENVTGLLVPAKDVQALQVAIEYLLVNPQKRYDMGQEGRRRILDGFDSQRIWQAIYEEYLTLAKNKGIDISGES